MTTLIEKDQIQNYIGFESEATDWLTIDQDRINQFADCTLDHQFIHVDPERAKETPFGTTIAHGFLSLSMLSYFSEQYSVVINGVYMGINYGFDKVRFLAPVKVGSRIRAKAKILAIDEIKPGNFRVNTEVTIEIDGETKPALVAEWIGVQMVA
ncbi:putative enoyl-CoA hydratase 1 [Zhongshania aliphaticivorans]|uniref:Putative enoyl-CoA hydratase 1 n=1 Tax=Zhongshania aliphaticivorans TaxID=1470434 RepID=A0A5S9Q3L7_9GAMM|nr:MaoC family dehydratase [Zhongshania aliphaticivorans]CAA0111521.1 putative enoyl-CoA hydratase 1 [Zhongshania aliphaticivorans]CAA0118671.1 putative enoyl-CoA hydratase 1 [Zhongshania aliphaticivorans]